MKRILKNKYIVILLITLLIALIYVSNITNLPNKIILLENEEIKFKTAFGINIESQTSSKPEFLKISAESKNSDKTQKVNYEVSLFGLKLKEINAYVIEKKEVIPLGNLIGLKLYTNGVLVVGMSEVVGIDNEKHKPYENTRY